MEETVLDEIDQVNEAEGINYLESKRLIGDSLSLVQDLVNLYKLLSHLIKEFGSPRDEIIAALQFLLACRYQLIMGGLAALRGHLTDSFSFIRKAIELCAFAALIKREPHLAEVWLSAGDEEASYRMYRANFSQKRIFPKNHNLLRVLYKRYDQCSRSIHPSLFSLARHIRLERTDAHLIFNFRYFELSADDPSEPIRTLLWLIDTHFIILKVFEEILSDIISSDHKKWEIWVNALEGKIAVHKERWRPIILRKDRDSSG